MDDKQNLPAKVEGAELKELRQWGSLAVSGKVVPYGTTVEQAMAIVQVGKEYGITPFNALRNFFFVNGKIGTSADFLAAQARKHGIKIEVIESTNTSCTMRFTRPDEKPVDISWTIEDAKRAGLVKPGSNWEKYPRQMLRARVKSDGSRLSDDSTVGLYTQDELIEAGEEIKPVEVVEADHLQEGLKDFTEGLGKPKDTPPAPEVTPEPTPEPIVYITPETATAIREKLKAINMDEAELCIDLSTEELPIGTIETIPESKLNDARDWANAHTPKKPAKKKESK